MHLDVRKRTTSASEETAKPHWRASKQQQQQQDTHTHTHTAAKYAAKLYALKDTRIYTQRTTGQRADPTTRSSAIDGQITLSGHPHTCAAHASHPQSVVSALQPGRKQPHELVLRARRHSSHSLLRHSVCARVPCANVV
jgi:hypothetical protein